MIPTGNADLLFGTVPILIHHSTDPKVPPG